MSALKSLEVAEMVQRQSAENLAIVNEQYRVGLSSSIERTDAQVTLTKAQGDVVRDRYDYQNALAHLGYLAGVLHVSEPPPPAAHAATPRSLP
jgi:outer membrane protein TolC